MKEINNNIPNFALNSGKIEPKKGEKSQTRQNNAAEENLRSYIRDTGILGRSQVLNTPCGGDIQESVNEAVRLAQNNPELLKCGDIVFENVYNSLLEKGADEFEAYINALAAQEEFTEIAAGTGR